MNHKKKYISLDKFIHQALYNSNKGFYMCKNPFGSKGDFLTAPNISILFSEMITVWIIAFWQKLKCPKKINLVELGSGNGEMICTCYHLLRNFNHLKNHIKFFY